MPIYLRYLKKNTEESSNHWSVEMTELLSAMNKERKERITATKTFTEAELRAYEQEYDNIMEQEKLENRKTKGRLAKQNPPSIFLWLNSNK